METLSNDVVAGRKRSDSICRSPWPIELHAGDKPKLQWIFDDYYDVPFGALDGLRSTPSNWVNRCATLRPS
jgi:hypothetical protein